MGDMRTRITTVGAINRPLPDWENEVYVFDLNDPDDPRRVLAGVEREGGGCVWMIYYPLGFTRVPSKTNEDNCEIRGVPAIEGAAWAYDKLMEGRR